MNQIIAYDTNTFEEKFRLIGETLESPFFPDFESSQVRC